MKRWQVAFQFVGIGWYVGLCIVLGVLGGRALDGRVNSTPAFMITGLILGIVAAFYGGYRMVIPMFSDNKNSKDEDKS